MSGINREFAGHFEAYTLHRASITLPEDFELLATSAACRNQIMKHKERNIYGFQFHPERSPHAEQFFANFIAIIQTSLIVPPGSAMMSTWK